MPSGFLRTASTVRGGVITMEKRPVRRLVFLSAPPSKVRSSQRTWKELSEARTTLVTSTATVSRPTLGLHARRADALVPHLGRLLIGRHGLGRLAITQGRAFEGHGASPPVQ